MAWIQVHQSLKDHRKLLDAADQAEMEPVTMLGTLVSIWLWALDNAPEGSLEGIRPRTLARAAQWAGDPDRLLEVLEDSGFLDRDGEGILHLHDWGDYAGKLIEQREAERLRSQRRRDKAPSGTSMPAGDRRTTGGQPEENRPETAGRVEKSREEEKVTEEAELPLPPHGGSAAGSGPQGRRGCDIMPPGTSMPAGDRRTTGGQPADNRRETAGRVEKSREEKKATEEAELPLPPHGGPATGSGAQVPVEDERADPGGKQPEPCPYQEIVTMFHELCTDYPHLRGISYKRRKALAARWKEYGRNMEVFRELFQKAQASGFLKGRNPRNWAADFDWLIGSSNMAKVLEGKYDGEPCGKIVSYSSRFGNTSAHNFEERDTDYESALLAKLRAKEM